MAAESSGESSTSGNDIYMIRLYRVLRYPIRSVLFNIYRWGCDKPLKMTVNHYLLKEKGMSNVNFKKCFSRDQIAQLEKDPEGKSYDVTLLYSCIIRLCNGIADANDSAWSKPGTLEYALQSVKNFRNSLVHQSYSYTEGEFWAVAGDIKIKTRLLYEKAGEKYGKEKEVQKYIDKAIREIDSILKEKVSMDVADSMDQYELLVKTEGKLETQKYLAPSIMSNCSSEIPGFHETVDTFYIFTDVNLVPKIKGGNPSASFLIQDILAIENDNGKIPSVTIIEGAAGVGKTTVLKTILSHWCKGTDCIRNMNQYDLCLYLEFRNPPYSNMNELLQMHMPKTSREMKNESLLKLVLNLKVLILMDGFDEINNSSQKIFNQILQLCNHNMHLLITTRPSKEDALLKIVSKNLEVCHLEIAGVSQDKLSEFVLKWHNIMSKGSSQQDVSKLCTFIHKTPWCSKLVNHPLNLTLLILLWTQAPKKIELLKTSTSLYYEMVQLMTDRLLNRIFERKVVFEIGELKNKLDGCLKLIFRESLNALRHDNCAINDADLILLKHKCSDMELPYEEVLSAFFTVTEVKNNRYIFPHKGFGEFYAALALCDLLKRQDDDEILQSITTDIHEILIQNNLPCGLTKRIRRDVQKTLRKNLNKTSTVLEILKDTHYEKPDSFSLSRYQKVLIHSIGLLKLQHTLSEQHAGELVDLLIESNMTDSEQWLNILTETDCDPNILGKVKEIISKKKFLYVTDAHLKTAACVLQDSEHEYVYIETFSDPSKLKYLKTALQALSCRKTQIHLRLHHHWHYPEQGCSDDFLQCLQEGNKKLRITQFTGSVRHLSSLCKQTEVLYVALGTPYAKDNDRDSDFICKSLSCLESLYIHITGGIPLECLPNLPNKFFHIDLWFSEIGNDSINWVADAAEKLAFKFRPFWSLRFPRSSLTADGCIELAQLLKGRIRVAKDGIIISSPCIRHEEIQTIEIAFVTEVMCSFRLLDEVKIWSLSP